MTLQEASQQFNRSESTLRRWIKTGKLQATLTDDGKYDIAPAAIENLVDKPTKEETITPPDLINQMNRQIDRQADEITFLRGELSKQSDENSEQSKRHDTIVLQMSQQLDRAQLQLEDLRTRQSPLQWLKAHLFPTR